MVRVNKIHVGGESITKIVITKNVNTIFVIMIVWAQIGVGFINSN